jgi:hypothetical protein
MFEPVPISTAVRRFGDAPELLCKIVQEEIDLFTFQVFDLDTAQLLGAGSGRTEMEVRSMMDETLSVMLAAREDQLLFAKHPQEPSA